MAANTNSPFLANMSHELRTPVNTILGMTDLALGSFPQETALEYLHYIRQAGQSLLLIINDILDFSRLEAGALKIVNEKYAVHSLIDDITAMTRLAIGHKPIDFIIDDDPALPGELIGDVMRIKQTASNLLTNAVKFTNAGRIVFSIRTEALAASDLCKLMISVEDTGIGIRREQIPLLFDSFSQLDTRKNHGAEGAGLGLPICKSLVELMGGELQVESVYGQGSRFSFYVMQQSVDSNAPLNEKTGTPDRNKIKRSPMPALQLRNVHALIVDDDDISLIITENALLFHGATVSAARSGREALALVQEKEFDIIFMDHLMPQIDGIDATRMIRALAGERFARIPIVALTANVIGDVRELFLQSGMNDFLAKPLENSEIQRVLQTWLPPDKWS